MGKNLTPGAAHPVREVLPVGVPKANSFGLEAGGLHGSGDLDEGSRHVDERRRRELDGLRGLSRLITLQAVG